MKRIVLLSLFLLACGDSRLSPQGGTITSVQGGNGLTGGGTGGLVTLNVAPATGGGLSVLSDSIGMVTTCSSTQVLQWDGDSWECANSSSFSTNNVIPKGSGTGLTASSLTDIGGDVRLTGSGAVTRFEIENTGTGGRLWLIDSNSSSGGAPNSLAIYDATAGAYRLTIGSNGDFTVNGTIMGRRASGAAGIVLGDGVNKDWTYYLSGNDLRLFEYSTIFGTGGGDRATFRSAGGLLLNATATSGTYQGATQLYVQPQTGGTDVVITARTPSEDRDVFIGVDETNDYARIGTTIAQPLVFRTSNADRVTIDSSGNLFTVANTTLGDSASDAHIINGVTTITAGTSTGAANPAGTTLSIGQAAGSHNYITLRGDNNLGISFNTPTQPQDGAIIYTTGTDDMRFLTQATVRQNITSGGTSQFGDTVNTAISNNLDVLVVANTGTGQTTNATALINATHSGSFDASAGAKDVQGLKSVLTVTRSAGSNGVTATAGYFSSATATGVTARSIETVGTALLTAPALVAGFQSNIVPVVVRETGTSQINIGAGIQFEGAYNGSATTEGALIKLMKANNTDANYDFNLALGTRASGFNLEPRLLIDAGGITNTLSYGVTTGAAGVGSAQDISSFFRSGDYRNLVAWYNANTLGTGTLTANVSWGKSEFGSTLAYVTSTDVPSPRGAVWGVENIGKLTCTSGGTACSAGGSDWRYYLTNAGTNNSDVRNETWTFSVWLRVASGTTTAKLFIARYNDNEINAGESCAVNSTSWVRCRVTKTWSNTSYTDDSEVRVYIQPRTETALYMWGSQVEKVIGTSYITPYIPYGGDYANWATLPAPIGGGGGVLTPGGGGAGDGGYDYFTQALALVVGGGTDGFENYFRIRQDGTTVLNAKSSSISFTVEENETGIAGSPVLSAFNATPSLNTTDASRSATSVSAFAHATESAGGNLLTNYAVWASAGDGDVNYSFYGAAGDMYNAGNFSLGGNASFSQNVTLGSSTSHTLNVIGYAGFNTSADSTVEVKIDGSGRTYALDVLGLARFDTGPIGINNYAGKHLDFQDEFISRANGTSCNGLQLGDTYACQAQGTGNALRDAADSPLGDTTAVNGRPGVWALDTGTTTTGAVRFTSATDLIDFNDGSWTLEGTFYILNLSTSGEEYTAIFGANDTFASANQVDGCYFMYDRGDVATNPNTGDTGGISGDNWSIWCASNSTRTGYKLDGTASEDSFTTITSTVANATWYRLKIVMEGTTKARFYINGTEVGRITTNIPSGNSRASQAAFQILKSAGTTARYLYVDQTRLAMDLTSARSP